MSAVLRSFFVLAVAALLALAAPASAQVGAYTECETTGDAIEVYVSAAGCEEALAVATALAGTPATAVEAAVLAAGWTPLRARAFSTREVYDVVAIRGTATLMITRNGPPPDLDGWTAGRELLFATTPLVPGAAPPKGTTVCTSSFLVRIGTRQGGLSAAHCAGLSKRTTRRRNTALRRAPQPGIVLGGVRRNLARRARPIDVLALPVPSGPGRPSAAVIDRGVLQPPWFVRGRARPLLGRRICFSGIASGPDRCGKIIRPFPGTRARGLTCTSIIARAGDSGSPVHTEPAADGTVRAVGIASVVVGILGSMCFVPIEPVLDALGATLVSAAG